MIRNRFWFLFQTTGDTIQSAGLLLLRVGVSIFMVLLHGMPKLSNFLQGKASFPDPIGLGSELSMILAIFAEILCSLLLIVGLFTRLAVIPLAFTMIVAAFIFNAEQDLIVKEKGIIYLIVYLFFLFTGSGKYSVDHYLISKRMKIRNH